VPISFVIICLTENIQYNFLYECFLLETFMDNPNMMFFIGYTNNTVIKNSWYIVLRTCKSPDKLWTSFPSVFMYGIYTGPWFNIYIYVLHVLIANGQ